VLVNILRAYLAGDERPRGWLGALSDRHVGTALRLMHGDVAKRWKVSDLASEVGMSRTSFAERFKSLVGMAPLEYLVRWRMALARNALTREVGVFERPRGASSAFATWITMRRRRRAADGSKRT